MFGRSARVAPMLEEAAVDISGLVDGIIIGSGNYSIAGPVKEKYQIAFAQLHTDLSLLQTKHEKLDGLAENFNRFISAHLLNFPDFLEASSRHVAFLEIAKLMPAGYKIPLSLPSLEILKMNSISTRDIYAQNVAMMIGGVANSMQACRGVHKLAYHTIGHALETSQASSFLCSKSHTIFKTLIGFIGLFHDAIFTHSRVEDEQCSAQLFLEVFQPFLEMLKTDEKSIFEALVRILLVGGTLPVFYKDTKSAVHMKTLWELYVEINPTFMDLPINKNLLDLLRSMSDADVQRSLNPETVANPAEGTTVHTPYAYFETKELSLLYTQLNIYFERLRTHAPDGTAPRSVCAKQDYINIVLTKLGQSIRFVGETIVMQIGYLLPVQTKMHDFIYSTADKMEFSDDDIEDIWNTALNSEEFFAEMNINSIKTVPARDYRFETDSWQWQSDLYRQFKKLNVEQKKQLTCELLINARRQQGLEFDLTVFADRMKPDLRSTVDRLVSERDLTSAAISETFNGANIESTLTYIAERARERDMAAIKAVNARLEKAKREELRAEEDRKFLLGDRSSIESTPRPGGGAAS